LDAEVDAAIAEGASAPRPPRRELRPCTRCGHVRRVLVTDDRQHTLTDERDSLGHPIYEFRTVGEHWEKHCTACRFELKAKHYAELAHENRRRAEASRARQKGKGP
jgi:hypothetical protein